MWKRVVWWITSLLRRLYWRYAAKEDPKLRFIAPGVANKINPPRTRFRVLDRQSGRTLFEGNNLKNAKVAFHGYTGVELYDGLRLRGQR